MAPANSKVSGLMAVASVALTASTTQAFVVATQHRRQRLPVQRLSVQQQRPGEVPSMVLGDYSDTQRIPDQPPSDGQQPLMGHGDFDVIDMLLQRSIQTLCRYCDDTDCGFKADWLSGEFWGVESDARVSWAPLLLIGTRALTSRPSSAPRLHESHPPRRW